MVGPLEVRRGLALAVSIFARMNVLGFQRLEYELTQDAIELGFDAALPAVVDLGDQIGEFGRGERDSASLTHQPPPGFLLINRTERADDPPSQRPA